MPNRGELSRMLKIGVDKSDIKIVWTEIKSDVKKWS